MPVELMQVQIGGTLTASEYFGSRPGLLVGVPTRGFAPFFTVPEGYYALVTSNGAEIEDPESGTCVWTPGFHFGMPWVSVSHLVAMGYILFDTAAKGCKSSDNVTVQIDASVVFRIMGNAEKGEDPNLVRKFVHQVTPRGLQQQLTDAIDEAVRMLARSMKHREVYGLRSIRIDSETGTVIQAEAVPVTDEYSKLPGNVPSAPPVEAHITTTCATAPVGAGLELTGLDGEEEEDEEKAAESKLLAGQADDAAAKKAEKAAVKGESATARIIKILNKQFQPQGVEITDLMITNVQLPQDIVSQMTNKTMVISGNAQEIMTQQFEMADLKHSEELKKLSQSFAEEREQEKQDGLCARNEAQVKLNSLKADADKQIRILQEENNVLLKSVTANANLDVTKLQQERNKIVSELHTQSCAEAARISSVAELYVVQKRSEADLESQKNDAKAMEVLSNAEGVIAPLLKEYNEHLVNLKKMEVFSSLSQNKDVIIAPSGNQDLQTMLLADEILSNAKSGSPLSRSEMLSELMVMKAGGQVAMNTGTGAAVLHGAR